MSESGPLEATRLETPSPSPGTGKAPVDPTRVSPETAATLPRTAPLGPGSKLGPYRIVSHLGRGGMGDVYRAHDEGLDRAVAVKTIAPALISDGDFVARFRAEARAAARIQHPNVVQVHFCGEDSGTFYFAMELVEGQSLGDLLRRHGPLPWSEAARLAAQVARALDAAHAHGVIHRDVKPENVLVTADRMAKVLDFGLAKRVEDAGVTASGVIVGTPRYMSPEQAQGEPLDARSDLYSLGATLFHTLAGQPVFDGSSPMKVCMRHVQEPPPDLGKLAPAAPRALVALVARLLEKRPERRPASGRAVAEELEALVASAASGATEKLLVPSLASGANVPSASGAPSPSNVGVVPAPPCPITGPAAPRVVLEQGADASKLLKRARADAPIAPRYRRFLADCVDVGHLEFLFAIVGLLPWWPAALLPWVPAALTAIFGGAEVLWLTYRGGTLGERVFKVRLVTATGAIPHPIVVFWTWFVSKATVFALFAAILGLPYLAEQLEWGKETFHRNDFLRLASCVFGLGVGALGDYGFYLITGASFMDRAFSNRVIDSSLLPLVEGEELA